MGVEMLLLAPDSPSGGIATWQRILRAELSDDIHVTMIDTAQRYVGLGTKAPWRRVLFGGRDAIKRVRQVLREVRRGKPDLVYITCAPSMGFWIRDMPLLWLLRIRGVSSVVHLHGGDVKGFLGRRPWTRWVARRSLALAHEIVALTGEVLAAITELEGLPAPTFIPNMLPRVEVSLAARRAKWRVQPSPDDVAPTVLHVGVQSIEKGVLEALETATLMPWVNFKFVGPITPQLLQVAGLADLPQTQYPNVQFVGQLDRSELREVYTGADVMLFPSHTEGFPMVVLEAMSYGLPVVATDVGQVADMLGVRSTRPAGLVVGSVPAVAQELFDELSRLLCGTGLYQALSASAVERVEKLYSSGTVVPQVEEVIRRAASGT